jgi:hypothetical protein
MMRLIKTNTTTKDGTAIIRAIHRAIVFTAVLSKMQYTLTGRAETKLRLVASKEQTMPDRISRYFLL